MTAPNGWPDEAREAVARATRQAEQDYLNLANRTGVFDMRAIHAAMSDAALGALAPYLAAREAAAFQRGAEKMREACVAAVRPKGKRPCDCERCDCGNAGDNQAVTAWDADAWNANALRALPIPEDKP